MCSYNLQDQDSGLLHKKRTGLVTASTNLKEAAFFYGQCTKDHVHEPLEGGSRCKRAQAWTEEFCTQIIESHLEDLDNLMVKAAFPAEAVEEEIQFEEEHSHRGVNFDGIDSPEDLAVGLLPQEESPEHLEEVHPTTEALENAQLAESRAEWRKLPMATRVAVRRLHTMTGHSSISSMQRILRTSGGDPKVIRALKHFRCPACEERKKPAPRPVTRPPSDYRFNVEVAIDCFEVKDVQGNRFTIFSVVDMGTLFHAAEIVSDKGGAPSSLACTVAFRRCWLNWAGPPRSIIVDRGLHNRGRFTELLQHHGVQERFIGVEAHHQLGRGERQGSILKQLLQHVIEARQLVGLRAFEMLLPEAVFIKNNRIHHGGFTPSQWTLGKLPIEVDSLTSEESDRYLGTHQDVLDGETAFARQLQLRQAAKEAFAFVDASQRLRASMLRKSSPTSGPFFAGDLVCFYRKQGTHKHGRWYGPARVLGQEGRSTLWIIHGGVPMTVGIESLRHATGGEVLAKRQLELRPSRKRRREAIEPDEDDDMDYPFADDFIGGPGAAAQDGQEQIPFFDLAADPTDDYTPELPFEVEEIPVPVDVPLAAIESSPGTAVDVEEIPYLAPPGLELLPPVPENDSEIATEIFGSTDEPDGEVIPHSRMTMPATDQMPLSNVTPLQQAPHRSVDALDGLPRTTTASRERSRSPPPISARYVPPEHDAEGRGFWVFLARRTTKKSATARAKELSFAKSDAGRRLKILEARGREWLNWSNFKAVTVLTPEEATEYLMLHPDVEVIPTRWVDTLKSQPWEPDRHKARLVVRGDLESEGNARTDSPTCSQTMLSLTLSICAAKRWKLRGGDITAAGWKDHQDPCAIVSSWWSWRSWTRKSHDCQQTRVWDKRCSSGILEEVAQHCMWRRTSTNTPWRSGLCLERWLRWSYWHDGCSCRWSVVVRNWCHAECDGQVAGEVAFWQFGWRWLLCLVWPTDRTAGKWHQGDMSKHCS